MADEKRHDEQNGEQKHKRRRGHHGGGSHKKHEEHEGAPEWLISFADNVTLMMGFFVIMLALNMNEQSDGPTVSRSDNDIDTNVSSSGWSTMSHPPFLDAAIAIREAFNNPVDMTSNNPNDLPLIQRIQERMGGGVSLTPGQTGPHHAVQSIRVSEFYSRSGLVPFNDNSAVLTQAQHDAAVEIANTIRGLRFVVEVRGHVSSVEAAGNVERAALLSHQRALAVAHVLAANGVDWPRIRIVAVGDADRAVPLAYDQDGHRSNQRVEVLVTKEVVPNDPHMRERTPAN